MDDMMRHCQSQMLARVIACRETINQAMQRSS
jgi:hypothetical protein